MTSKLDKAFIIDVMNKHGYITNKNKEIRLKKASKFYTQCLKFNGKHPTGKETTGKIININYENVYTEIHYHYDNKNDVFNDKRFLDKLFFYEIQWGNGLVNDYRPIDIEILSYESNKEASSLLIKEDLIKRRSY